MESSQNMVNTFKKVNIYDYNVILNAVKQYLLKDHIQVSFQRLNTVTAASSSMYDQLIVKEQSLFKISEALDRYKVDMDTMMRSLRCQLHACKRFLCLSDLKISATEHVYDGVVTVSRFCITTFNI